MTDKRRIGPREIATLGPNSLIWDTEVSWANECQKTCGVTSSGIVRMQYCLRRPMPSPTGRLN